MAAAANLKNRKLPYLGRRFSDFNEIWHGDAVQRSWPFGPLKFEIKKSKMAAADIVKKPKITIPR